MKITIYGADICSDCLEAKAVLGELDQFEVEYKDITGDTRTLKEFLSYRDKEGIFRPVKEAGGIGIPLFLLENGEMTLDLDSIVEVEAKEGKGCSLDGKGC